MAQHLHQCGYIELHGVGKNERKQYSKEYGINRRSILCDLPYFDVTTQLPQDVMHVVFEGLYHLQIKLFLGCLFDDFKVSCPL